MRAKSVVPAVSLILILFSVLSGAEPLKAADAVLDNTGVELNTSAGYVITPWFRPNLGSVSYSFSSAIRCSGDVIQSIFQQGVPFAFYPVDTDEQIIRVGAELHIGEARYGLCRGVVYWKVGKLKGKDIVKFGLDMDGKERATFKITGTPGKYTLNQCNHDRCRYVGSYLDANGTVHLALTKENPTSFFFVDGARVATN